MGTAQRRKAPEDGGAATRLTVREGPEAPNPDIPAARAGVPAGPEEKAVTPARVTSHEREEREEALTAALYPPLWVEEPARRRRLPDPVRTAAVRAVLIIAVTLMQAMVAFLCTLAGSWLAFPMVLSSVASTVVATWAALDVWVTRQVWNQRHGVVSTPASTARQLRRERRRAQRQARAAGRGQERIHGRGGAGQLSHS
jgi:type VI protein secretion system component VasF